MNTNVPTAWALPLLLISTIGRGADCLLPRETFVRVRQYAETVTQYRNGRFQEAGTRLQAGAEQGFDDIHEALERMPWPFPCALAAVMLHTEVGIADVRQGLGDRYAHFETAWSVSAKIGDGRKRKRLQRDWLLLVGLFYQGSMFDPHVLASAPSETLSLGSELFTGARKHLDEAVLAAPEDAEVLLAAGALLEWSGSPNFGERGHLGEAEKLYERAVRAAPDDPIAQLRYGVTLWKRGRSDRAVPPLRRVLELTDDDELVFRAHMSLGRIDMLAGRYANAVTRFRAAVERKPHWQIGTLALSHALHRSGARDESRAVLQRGLDLPWDDDNLFGWWRYETGLSGRFGDLLESMRAEALAP